MLTTFEDDEYVREALRFGVSGYLLKSIPTAELLASLRAALTGALQLDPPGRRGLGGPERRRAFRRRPSSLV